MISVDHAIQRVIHDIQGAWDQGKKVTMLLMDICGAYNNVAHLRLLYDLQLLHMQQLAPWIGSFLSNRATRLSMTGILSELFGTPTGIPQGSPISLILFLIYNTPLIDNCWSTLGTVTITPYGWVDDTCAIAESESYATNIKALEEMLGKADKWARGHASKFAPEKFELIHFANPDAPPESDYETNEEPEDIWKPPMPSRGSEESAVRYPTGVTIRPTKHVKYLGI